MLARVRWAAPPGTVRPRGHLLLRVTGEGGVWHADVGFGAGTLLEPIPFGPGEEHEQEGWRFRVVQDGEELVLQSVLDDQWSDLYGFVPKAVPLVDLETSNWFTCSHPASPFVTGLLIAAQTADGTRTTLSDWGELALVTQTPARAHVDAPRRASRSPRCWPSASAWRASRWIRPAAWSAPRANRTRACPGRKLGAPGASSAPLPRFALRAPVGAPWDEGSQVKLVIGIVRPERSNDVLEALYRAEVTGLSISRVQGHGGELDRVETYRGTTVKMELSDKVRFEIAVSEPFVQATIDALCAGCPHGRGGRRQDLRGPARAGRADPHRRGRHRRRHAARRTAEPARPSRTSGPGAIDPAVHRLDAGRHGAGADDDPRPRPLLRRPRPQQEHAQHVHDERRGDRDRDRHVGTGGLLAGLRRQRRLRRRPAHGRPARRRLRAPARDPHPPAAVHGLRGDLLHHHHRAGLGRRGRADELRRPSWCSRPVVGARVPGARPLGLGRGLAGPARRARLRRRRARRDGLGLLGVRGRARRAGAQGLRAPGAAAPQRRLRAARGRAAVVRVVRLQRRQRLLGRPSERAGVRQHAAHAGLHAGRLVPARPRSATGASPRSARPRRSSSAASGSPRPPATSARPRRCCWARWRRCRATR